MALFGRIVQKTLRHTYKTSICASSSQASFKELTKELKDEKYRMSTDDDTVREIRDMLKVLTKERMDSNYPSVTNVEVKQSLRDIFNRLNVIERTEDKNENVIQKLKDSLQDVKKEKKADRMSTDDDTVREIRDMLKVLTKERMDSNYPSVTNVEVKQSLRDIFNRLNVIERTEDKNENVIQKLKDSLQDVKKEKKADFFVTTILVLMLMCMLLKF